jgi:membrane-associated phospholipid phosphatase
LGMHCGRKWIVLTLSLTILVGVLIVLEYFGLFTYVNIVVSQYLGKQNSLIIYFLTLSGSSEAFLIYFVVFLTYDFIKARRLRAETVSFVIALIISMLAVFTLKITFQVPRPGEVALHYSIIQAMVHFDYFSFPSGHAARASVLAYFGGKRRGLGVKTLLWSWALGVALSRLLLGKHWLSDVVTSLFLGLLVSLATDSTLRYWGRLYNKTLGKVGVLRIELPD